MDLREGMTSEMRHVIEIFTTLNFTIKNGVKVSATSLNLSDMAGFCHQKPVRDFARVVAILANTQNRSANSTSTDPLSDFRIQVSLTCIFILVGAIGLIGNLLTVLVIYKTTSLHSHTNYFLASLGISDLLLIVIGVPYDLIHIWRKNRPPIILGYCAITSTSISLFTYASILTIVSLTAERFVAICYPFSHRRIFDKRRVINLIYLIWILSFIPSLYIGLQFKRVVPDFCGYNHLVADPFHDPHNCDYITEENTVFRYPFELAMLFSFVLPLIFIVYCYVRILGELNKMKTQTTVHQPVGTTNSDTSQMTSPSILYVHTKNPAPHKSQQAQRMVIKMLVTVTAVFFVCYLPYHVERLIVSYLKHDCDQSKLCQLLYPITGLLQYISATLNPIFYNLMSNRFRVAFKTLIKQLIPSKDREYSSIANR